MSNPAIKNHSKLRRFLTGLWITVLIAVLQVSWPYAAAFTLFAICLHFAALDGPLIEESIEESIEELTGEVDRRS
jgi:hypothetical protein